ncbi:MAG: hypothetical protein FJZ63_04640 [Chlamydiae bacterium]|nr:hypothetical protein [Chlamydiota bacterium]
MEEHFLSPSASQHQEKSSGSTKLKPHALLQEDTDKKAGDTFFKQGELRLLHGDDSGVRFFDLALQLDPSNAKLYYDQGLALLDFGSEKHKEKYLLLATKRFKSAICLDSGYFEAHLAMGHALFSLGNATGEFHYFLSAEKAYANALSLQEGRPKDLLADLHWNYGRVWSILAKHSKEPSDQHKALEAFRTASSQLEHLPVEFWNDYGYACLHLGHSLQDLSYCFQGIHCFKNATSMAISSFESWLHLASALSHLYSFTHDEDHFTQANECYTTAAQLNSQNALLWLRWAELLYTSASLTKDQRRMRACVEKCHKSLNLEKDDLTTIALLAKALANLGVFKEDVALIHEAQNHLIDFIEEMPTPEIIHAYAVTLFCLGQYFHDLDYFYQAAERFQEGLSINRTLHELWHGLAQSYTQAALMEEDPATFEKAHKFYQKALDLQPVSTYHFDYGCSLLRYAEHHNSAEILEKAINHFEQALHAQKNALYIHPEWLFHYGVTLDLLAAFQEEPSLYTRALEALQHVLIIDPEYPLVHYHLALVYSHIAELGLDAFPYAQACSHYKLAYKRQEDNDHILLDWAITLASLGDALDNTSEALRYFKDAEFKMIQAAKLGNVHAYYHLACLYSLLNHVDKAMHFMKKAADFDALPHLQELFEDDWLENLRKTVPFQNFLSLLEKQKSSSDAS